MNYLPKNWAAATVSDIFNLVGGGTPTTRDAAYWNGNIPWVSSADIQGVKDINATRYISKSAVESSTTNIVPKGAILVVSRVGLGKLAIAPSEICFSQDIQALIKKGPIIDDNYALHFLSKATQLFRSQSRGTTIPGVTKKQVAQLEFPLPPLAEQKRIVTKIEELFTDLDAGVEALKKSKILIKKYRQSVLKAAFEGKLTESWRNKNYHKTERAVILLKERILAENRGNPENVAKEPHQMDSLGCGSLSTEWLLIELSSLFRWSNGEGLIKKEMASGDFHVYGGNGISGCHNKWIAENESIVIGRVGAQCGNVNISRPKSWITDNAIYSSWNSSHISLKFTFHLLTNMQLNRLAGGSGQPYVSQTILNSLRIRLPFLDEQQKIVEEIEDRFSIADASEKIIDAGLKQAERLRQSILKKAFEGRLVPQDPHDEPAQKLLERIKAEKNRVPSKRPGSPLAGRLRK